MLPLYLPSYVAAVVVVVAAAVVVVDICQGSADAGAAVDDDLPSMLESP